MQIKLFVICQEEGFVNSRYALLFTLSLILQTVLAVRL